MSSKINFPDWLAIQQNRLAFAHALDTKNFDSLDAIFTNTVAADFSAYGIDPATMDRATLINFFRHSFARPTLRTQHIYSNFVITVDGSSGSCRSNFVGYHYEAGFPEGNEFILHAQYEDGLVQSEGKWRISSVKLSINYANGNQALLG